MNRQLGTLQGALWVGFASLLAGCTMTVSPHPLVSASVTPQVATVLAGVTAATGQATLTTAVATQATAVPTQRASSTPTPRPVIILVTPSPTAGQFAPASRPPDRIVAPSIGLDASVVPLGWTPEADGSGAAWQPLPDGAAGWDAASAYPGHGSNVVIAGHHNIAGEVFRDLIKLKRGDEVILDADGQIYRYRVSEILILPERDVPEQQRLQNATWMQPTRHERLTLITCWPYESNTHRLVVVALPEGSEPVKMAQVNQNP